MDEKMIFALDECLVAISEGVTLEDCLRRYPDLANQLRPALEVLIRTQEHLESIQPASGVQENSRKNFLIQARSMKNQSDSPIVGSISTQKSRKGQTSTTVSTKTPSLSDLWDWLSRAFALQTMRAFVFFFLFLFASAGVINASAQSLPGTPLYGLKRTLETTRLSLTTTGEDRAKLEDEFLQQRRNEVKLVTTQGKSVPVEFGGILESIENDYWVVAGITVTLSENTKITGNPIPGLYLHIYGNTQNDHTFLATDVSVEGEIFRGILRNIRGSTWLVEERTVYVNFNSLMADALQPGDQVEVNGMYLSDGGILAESIRLIARNFGSNKDPQTINDGKKTPNTAENSKKTPEETKHNNQSTQEVPLPNPTNNSGVKPATSTPNSSSGKSTPEPTRTIEPTRTQMPTQTPNSGGKAATQNIPPAIKEVRIQGVLGKMDRDSWVISGQTIYNSPTAQIDGSLKIGDLLEVQAQSMPDGRLLALKIRKKN